MAGVSAEAKEKQSWSTDSHVYSETYTVYATHTWIRLPFRLQGNFMFNLERLNRRGRFVRMLGLAPWHVPIGHPAFDRRVSLSASQPAIARELFADEMLREMVLNQPGLNFVCQWNPDRRQRHLNAELRFDEARPIDDPERFTALGELFGRTMDRLVDLDLVEALK